MLKGGKSPWEGNVWAVNPVCELGPVCDHEWDSQDAMVVCSQLGSNFSIPIIGNEVREVKAMNIVLQQEKELYLIILW